MAKKVDIELVKAVLQRNEIDVRLLAQIMEDIRIETENAVDEEKAPPVKKQYVILVSDPKGVLEKQDLVGWVAMVPEDEDVRSVEDRLIRGGAEFNATPKGHRFPLKTIAEICEHAPARLLKEHNVWVRTKEPVFVVRTVNKIPETTLKAAAPRDVDF